MSKGYRFEIGASEIFEGLTHDEKKIVHQLLSSDAAVGANEVEKVAKIDAEVATEKERAKREERAKSEPWTRAHKLQVTAVFITITVGIAGFYYWYFGPRKANALQQGGMTSGSVDQKTAGVQSPAINARDKASVQNDSSTHTANIFPDEWHLR